MRYAFLSLLILLPLLGCHAAKPATSSSVIEGIVVDVWASSDCVQPGETVKLRATVTNKGTRTQITDLKDKPVLDLIVGFNKPSGTIRWSDAKPLTPDLTRLELKSGQSKTIEMNWTVPKDISFGPVGVNAQFIYAERGGGVVPSVLVDVGFCPGGLP